MENLEFTALVGHQIDGGPTAIFDRIVESSEIARLWRPVQVMSLRNEFRDPESVSRTCSRQSAEKEIPVSLASGSPADRSCTTGDLLPESAPHEKADIEPNSVPFQCRAVEFAHLANHVPHASGRLVETRRRRQSRPMPKISLQQRHHGLSQGEAPAVSNTKTRSPGMMRVCVFPARLHLIDPGIRPGVGGENQPLVRSDSKAIGNK